MSDNALVVIIALSILGGVAVVGIGAYILLQGHSLAGGLTIFAGLLLGQPSINRGPGHD